MFIKINRLYANVLSSDEYRVEGSQRWNSLELIRKAGEYGLAVETYLSQGGNAKFIPWFLNRAEIRVQ